MEYGGCLHFEINQNEKDYYSKYIDNRIDVDSGRSALQYILENYEFNRIWLPVYNCPLVGKRVQEISDIEIVWYNLSETFNPIINKADFCEGDVFLWVNYFGIMPNQLIDQIAGLQMETLVKVIIDNIPAYFAEPRMDVFNLYSCRKFIGVPDGGHVIGNAVKKITLPTYANAEKFLYLLEAIETGSNSVYASYQESEKRFFASSTAYGMPELTQRVLKGIEYEKIKRKRKDNFLRLHHILAKENRLTIDISTDTPSVYPYLTTKKELRNKLIENIN